MKLNNFGYLLKQGFRGIFRRGFMSFAAICVTVACLLIVGTFSAVMYNLNIIVSDMNKNTELLVFVDETLTDAEARSVGSDINLVDNVANSIPITREEAMQNFAADYDYDVDAGLDPTIFRHRFRVSLVDNRLLHETMEKLYQVPGVANISAPEAIMENFTLMQDILLMVSLVIIGILLVVSLLIISNTVKLAMYDRRDEIAIMRMVGATNGFIRFPFVVQGFVLGMVGAGLAFGLEWLMYDNLLATIGQTLKWLNFVPISELLLPMRLVFGGAGLFVGVVGSWTSIRKFMNV